MIYARTTLHMLTQVFLLIHRTRHISTDFMLFYIPQKNYLNSSITFTKHLPSDRQTDRQITAEECIHSQGAIYCARHDVITYCSKLKKLRTEFRENLSTGKQLKT